MSYSRSCFIEEPVDLLVNGKKLVTFMCTPDNLEDLAMGYLYTKGLIEKRSEFIGSSVCESGRRLFSLIDKKVEESAYNIKEIILSGCGSGEVDTDDLFLRDKISKNYSSNLVDMRDTFIKMNKLTRLYKSTGGTHSAAIVDNNNNLIVREDIGRHNAVDKVIGAALEKGMNLEKSTIVVTGRISSDMVIKASGAGIPIVASMRITSNLAISLANKYGVTLIGRLNSSSPIIYNDVDGISIN